jgi:hypothetical protein
MSRKMRWATNEEREEERNAYRLLVEKSEEKGPLGRSRRMWMDNIEVDLGNIGWGVMGLMDLTQDRDK